MILPRSLSWILILVLIFLYIAAWRSVRVNLTDFVAFYSSARLFESGENPFDREAQCRKQTTLRSDLCMPNPHPPVLLPLFALVSNENYYHSYVRWSALLVLVLAACVWIGYLISHNLESTLHCVLFYPTLISITQGQVSAFLLLGLLLFILFVLKRQDLWAGVALSLTVIKPQFAVFLALPLLFSRRRVFLGFFIGSAILLGSSFALVGVEGFHSLFGTLIAMMRGLEPGTDPQKMYSIAGIIARVGFARGWAWVFYLVGLIATTVLWRRMGLSIPAMGIGIVLATFASPHLYTHDLLLLAAPLFLIHPQAPVLASLVLLLSLYFGFPYTGALALMACMVGFFGLRGELIESRLLNSANHFSSLPDSTNPIRSTIERKDRA